MIRALIRAVWERSVQACIILRSMRRLFGEHILQATVDAMNSEGRPFKGRAVFD